MNVPLRVFVCSTVTDLVEERKAVLDAVRRLQLVHDAMEFFGASAKLPIKTCLEEVRKSDILVVVIGHRYGNLVPGRGVSFSEAEYREGHRLRKPCLVYVRDENIPVLPKNMERDPEKIRLLEKWKRTLARRHTTAPFSDCANLASQVTADISRTLRGLDRIEGVDRPTSNYYTLAVARTKQLRQAMADLERAYDITLEALGDALDLKDAEAEGHSKRVTAYTIAIARAMRVRGKEIRIIARGAYLHDIGKMAIPDAILRKPGPLTAEETDVMRTHCFLGYQILKKIPFLAEASEIVYAHQEKYDGTGYPRGLRGENIPLGARIFSVADTLDAITSDRPYRLAQSIAVAREEVERLSGTHFDPQVARIFLEMPNSIWEDLRREVDKQVGKLSYPIKVDAIPSSVGESHPSRRFTCPHCGREVVMEKRL